MSANSESGVCNQSDMDNALREVRDIFPLHSMWPTGSVYTNGQGADCDVLLHGCYADKLRLIRERFTVCAATEYGDATSANWTALRRGNVNVILCFDYDLYLRWKAAGEVCRWIGCTTKYQRIVLHELIKNLVPVEVAIERATAS